MNLIDAKEMTKAEASEVINDPIDIYFNVVFSLLKLDMSFHSSIIKNQNNNGVVLIDNLLLRNAYINNPLEEPEENSKLHKEIVIDCSDLQFDEYGSILDAQHAHIKIIEACLMAEEWLQNYSIYNNQINIHFNIYAFEQIEEIANGFAITVDALMSPMIGNDKLEDIILYDYIPFFKDYIEKGWKSTVEYIGLFASNRIFYLNIDFTDTQKTLSSNQIDLKSPSKSVNNTTSQSIEQDTSRNKTKGSSPSFEDDPFWALMHLDFGGQGMMTSEYGDYDFSQFPSKMPPLKARIEYAKVIDTNNEQINESDNSYQIDDNDCFQETESSTCETSTNSKSIQQNDKKTERHPFIWFIYSALKPIAFLSHEGLKGSGYENAMDEYTLALYYTQKGDESNAKKHLTIANSEFAKGNHNLFNACTWLPFISQGASVLDGIYYVGQAVHAQMTGNIDKRKEYLNGAKWAIIGAIPFHKLFRFVRIRNLQALNSTINSAEKKIVESEIRIGVLSKNRDKIQSQIKIIQKSVDKTIRKIKGKINNGNSPKKKWKTNLEKYKQRLEDASKEIKILTNEFEKRADELDRLTQTYQDEIRRFDHELSLFNGIDTNTLLIENRQWFHNASDFILERNLFGDGLWFDRYTIIEKTAEIANEAVVDYLKNESSDDPISVQSNIVHACAKVLSRSLMVDLIE